MSQSESTTRINWPLAGATPGTEKDGTVPPKGTVVPEGSVVPESTALPESTVPEGTAPELDGDRGIPDATIARLPGYLQALSGLAEDGVVTVSSEDLAEVAGVNSAKLRKDLSYLGSYGTRGVGYEVKVLITQISENFGLNQDWKVAIVGAGHLGKALANYPGFGTRGFSVVAMFDVDPAIVGSEVAGLTVRDVAELEPVIASTGAHVAVLAVPAAAAQSICDRVVAGGVTGVLNFAPTVLQVPESVQLRKVDLSTELQILAFHAQRAAADEWVHAREVS